MFFKCLCPTHLLCLHLCTWRRKAIRHLSSIHAVDLFICGFCWFVNLACHMLFRMGRSSLQSLQSTSTAGWAGPVSLAHGLDDMNRYFPSCLPRHNYQHPVCIHLFVQGFSSTNAIYSRGIQPWTRSLATCACLAAHNLPSPPEARHLLLLKVSDPVQHQRHRLSFSARYAGR
jgi:hypothetical protein